MKKPKAPLSHMVAGLILFAGGLYGIVVPCALAVAYHNEFPLSMMFPPIVFVYLLVFAYCIWIGYRLFMDDNAKALKWAKFLFLAQVPNVTIPGFTYQFQTLGVAMKMSLRPGLSPSFFFGSNISVYISSAIQSVVVGINVVALLVLLWIQRKASPVARPKSSGFGLA